MKHLYRLVYASEAKVEQLDVGVNLEIARILSKSKRNNAKLGIGGILYYADGYFFQVLEGPEAAVHRLYQRICRDPRHKNARVLEEQFINYRLFGEWSMKFMPNRSHIKQLLNHYKLASFSPFSFPPELTKALVTQFSYGDDEISASSVASSHISSSRSIFGGVKRALHAINIG